MSRLLEGRVAIVTGAGRGIGRAHALELARHGAKVVVNDYGVSLAGEDVGESPAHQVVAEIEAMGGEAVVNGADVADFDAAAAMVQQAIDTYGGLDILVNNAGFVRDRMLVNTSEEEWDAVIRVHLKGHFAPLKHAGAYWRAEAKEGRQRVARVINTSSGAGLQGSVGQATYSAAKAGIAGLTLVAAQEMGRYGVTVNAIAPVAKTRMTEGAFDTSAMALPEDNSPIVAWLASDEAGDVTGRVIEIDGSKLTVENGWAHGPSQDIGRRWEASEVGTALRGLFRRGADAGARVRRRLRGATTLSSRDLATGRGGPAGRCCDGARRRLRRRRSGVVRGRSTRRGSCAERRVRLAHGPAGRSGARPGRAPPHRPGRSACREHLPARRPRRPDRGRVVLARRDRG